MRARFILAAAATALLAGCASVPEVPVITQEVAAEPPPVDVAVPVSENTSEGLTENDWGGEVPEAKPTEDVGESGLGDLD
jgi:type IV pilus biogenesis protein CpaD/CtpE